MASTLARMWRVGHSGDARFERALLLVSHIQCNESTFHRRLVKEHAPDSESGYENEAGKSSNLPAWLKQHGPPSGFFDRLYFGNCSRRRRLFSRAVNYRSRVLNGSTLSQSFDHHYFPASPWRT